MFLSINNETRYVPLLFQSLRFMTNALSFILGKLPIEEATLNIGS